MRGDLYLAGGTALALHLGHRRSFDLDFFSRRPRLDLDRIQTALVDHLDAEILARSDATLRTVIGGVSVDLVRYPYSPLEPLHEDLAAVAVASLRDLAAMKLAAIVRRGLRRDFWDLHAIFTRADHTLAAAFADYRAKFRVAEADVYCLARALTWFEDAEADPLWPRGLSRRHWAEIREWFEGHVPAILTSPRRRAARRARAPRRR